MTTRALDTPASAVKSDRFYAAAVFVIAVMLLALVSTMMPVSTLPAGAQAQARLMGLHLNDSGTSAGEPAWKDALVSRQLGAGRRLDLVATSQYGFEASFPTWREPWILANGSTPVVNWAIGYTPAIERGSMDKVLGARADSLRALNAPVLLMFAPGMDATSSKAGTSAASFKNAWGRAHAVFAAHGASNVSWVWCPSAGAWANGTATSWYPGADSVDWACAEGVSPSPQGQTFSAEFGPFQSGASALGKRLMIGSFGVTEGTPGQKAAWISDAYNSMASGLSQITAAIYDDTGTTALATSASATSAWNAGVSNPALYTTPVVPLPGGKLVRASGASLGALMLFADPTTEEANWATLEWESGHKLAIAHTIYAWGKTFPTWREPWHIQNGRVPMISWGGTNTTEIASGKDDAYIRSEAQALKALGSQVFLRWFWEMDGSYFSKSAVSPAAFKAAWAHIHAIFDAEGATNVVWVWSPTAYGVGTGVAQAFYPGPALVDWIAADGFDWYPRQAGSHPASFGTIFTPFYGWAIKQGKPLMVASTGAVESNDPNGKAAWLRDMGTAAQVLFPGIRAIVYYDRVSASYNNPTVLTFSLDSSPNSMQAWSGVATQPYFTR